MPNLSPVIGHESVPHSCGHSAEFPLFQKDPYLEGRREKHKKRKCKDCSAQAERQRQEEAKARKTERKARAAECAQNAAKNGQQEKEGNGKGTLRQKPLIHSLPIGVTFAITRTGENSWHGSLGVSEEHIEVTVEDPFANVQMIANKLTRKWLAMQEQKEQAEATS